MNHFILSFPPRFCGIYTVTYGIQKCARAYPPVHLPVSRHVSYAVMVGCSALGHKNALHRLYCPHRALISRSESPQAGECDIPNLPYRKTIRLPFIPSHGEQRTKQSVPPKGHSCPLKLPLCNRSCARYHCRETVPAPLELRIVSCVSPPFSSHLHFIIRPFMELCKSFLIMFQCLGNRGIASLRRGFPFCGISCIMDGTWRGGHLLIVVSTGRSDKMLVFWL